MPDNNKIEAVQRPEIKADHGWYNSLFTQLLAPLVATRYVWLAIEEINPFNFLVKDPPEIALDKRGEPIKKNGKHITTDGKHITPDGTPWKEKSFGRYASRNFAAFGIGTMVLAIVGKYSKDTLSDIKSIYAEAVGYELDKKPQDVTLSDIFVKSQNEALKVTRDAYVKRTLTRSAMVSAFFVPWYKLRDKSFRSVQPKYDVNANAGIGAVGVNIYAEGFLRKPSFFDLEQKMASQKINHNDIDPYVAIQPQDIQTLLSLQRKHLNAKYRAPLTESKEGQNDIKLATRISKLSNDTYDSVPPENTDSFTLGKLNYLIGFGLLDKFPESLAYVELANKSVDMKAVKQVAAAIKNGDDSQGAFAKFGVDMRQLSANSEPPIQPFVAETKKFTQNIQPKTLMDFATQSPATHLAI